MMSHTITLPVALNAGSLESYFQRVSRIPICSAEEEKMLAKRYREQGDLDAARQLVMSHLRFVVKIARGYSGYGLPQADLIQEGSIGLMKAVKRFDPALGVRLVSFAVHWIRAEIHEFIIRNWKIVKIATTKAQRKLFFKLRSTKKHLGWLNNGEVNSVAKDLGVKPSDVIEMEKRLSGQDVSFDVKEADDSPCSPSTYLEDKRHGPEQMLESRQVEAIKLKTLARAITGLDERSQAIVKKRWLNDRKPTLHQLAEEYGISAERVRQIEKSAFSKIAESMAW